MNEINKIKICECFAGEDFLYGGQEEFLINMFKNFNYDVNEYTFFTPFIINSKKLDEMAEDKKIQVFSANKNVKSIFRKFYTIFTFKKFLKNKNFDVVHIHSSSILDLALVAKIAKKSKIKKVIVHSHNSGVNNIKYRIIKRITDRLFKKYADVYLACSHLAGVWKFPKDIMDKNKCVIINNGIDTNKFKFDNSTRNEYRQSFGIRDNELALLNVGRFSEQKNHNLILEIAQKLKIENFAFKFILVGEGELKNQFIQKSKESGVFDKFIILEKRNDINKIMMASDLFILPSLFEGFPVVAIESQCSGLPTICSDTITKEVVISDLCKQLSIDNSSIWVEEIKNYQKPQKSGREEYSMRIKNMGYDAATSARLLERIYSGARDLK